MHVLADAFTSILAITALTGGKFFGWGWLDPVVGIVGSGVVFSWSYTLLRDTGGVLLDRTPPSPDFAEEICPAAGGGGRSGPAALQWGQVCPQNFPAVVSTVAPHAPDLHSSHPFLDSN